MQFEKEFERMLQSQIRTAEGQRLEMLRRDKTGEMKLFCEVLRPVLPSVAELIMEHEIVSASGVKIYIDFLHPVFRWGIEAEGFIPHAQNISRDRFDFERMRIRTMAILEIKFIPFSWDELDKKTEWCRRTLYELLGRYSAVPDNGFNEMTVYEKEIIYYSKYCNRPIKMRDVIRCTQLKEDACRKILKSMVRKGMLVPLGRGESRTHSYLPAPEAVDFRL